MTVRIPLQSFLVLALAALAAGCAVLDPPVQPPCPPILVLKDAAQLVRYRPGPGRDVTDALFDANVANFQAKCKYDRKRTKVNVDLYVDFDVRRGPANTTRKAAFDYFVAIPKFYPAPQGKRVFTTTAAFKGYQTRLRYRDHVELAVPLDPKRPRDEYAVYLGFQLTPEDVEANRRRRAR